MKNQFIYFILSIMLVRGDVFGNREPLVAAISSENHEQLSGVASAIESLVLGSRMWQDAYAELLQESWGTEFLLYDIDSDGTPELLAGGPQTETDKYANYDVYTYKNYNVRYLGEVGTLNWSFLWADNNGGILGYSYGAGSGGTYRYYIDDGVLCYDGEVYGYYFDREGNETKWFRGVDGERVIVTEENEYEYERIWTSNIELECYNITEENITTVIYDGLGASNCVK